VSYEPGVAGERQGDLVRRLRAVVEAKDAEIGVLRGELAAERELRRRLELRLAEVERRLSMDSSDSGTPSSKERIGAKEARRARQQSERERSKGKRPGQDRAARGTGGEGRNGPGRQRREGRGRRAARADRPHPRRAADLPAGHRLTAQGGCRRRDPGRVHRAADHRRVHRVPAPAVPAGRHPAVLSALPRYCGYVLAQLGLEVGVDRARCDEADQAVGEIRSLGPGGQPDGQSAGGEVVDDAAAAVGFGDAVGDEALVQGGSGSGPSRGSW
jgi:hypothetical protein